MRVLILGGTRFLGRALVQAAHDALLAAGLEEWMGVPLWIASPGWEATNRVAVDKAVAAGLRLRPLAETIRGALDDAATVEGVDIDPDRERDLLGSIGAQ
jgi:hypothetical protein